MSWRVEVMHRTVYQYDSTVHASYNEARISPLEAPSQFTLEHRVEVTPPGALFRYRDYWGTRVHAFDLHEPHDRLEVVGRSIVETAVRTATPDPDVGWEALSAEGVADRLCEYLAPTRFTTPDREIEEVARRLRAEPTPAAAVDGCVRWVHEALEYTRGSTTVTTTAVEALAEKKGVCQDFAHIALSILRVAGIPARYASGYLFPESEVEVGVTSAGEMHAWLEAWVGEWCPIDPTSAASVAERHVVVAHGRDYADVPPLKGVFHGGRAQSMDVTVELTRIA